MIVVYHDDPPSGNSRSLHERSCHDLHRIRHPRGARPHRRRRLLHGRVRVGRRARAARLGRADDRLSRVHAVARGVPAGHRRRAHRHRPRRRRDVAEARQEVVLGLRRRRPCAGRDDLEGRDVVEEGHRPGHPADRRDRAPAGRRGRRREQAVLRRPRPGGGQELRPQVRRVRHDARHAGALRAPRAGQGRRRLPGRHRIAPDRHRRRCRVLHRPGRVRLGGRRAAHGDAARGDCGDRCAAIPQTS